MPSPDDADKPWMYRFESVAFQDPDMALQNYHRISRMLSPSLAQALPALLGESPDSDSALLLFERLLSEASPDVLRLIEDHPFLAHYAIAVFGNSWYLGETLIRNSDLLQTFLREKSLDRSYSQEDFSEGLARFCSRSFERDTSLLLSRFKRREYVRIMLRDVLRIAPLAETTGEISALSDVLIEAALRDAESAMERRFGPPQHVDPQGRSARTPLAVLSLGKLGGSELNYSSDIDLLFLYGDGDGPPSASLSHREYFVRLTQHMTDILSRPTPEGPVFRIDLRLRPQGNEGELTTNLAYALHYYAVTAHDWERQALIKARFSAGNEPLARDFIRKIQPQVYSEKINFAAIKTALMSREKIERKRRRQIKAEGSASLDVKIDRGGIRDIEFLVQCLQRVYGGTEPWLRSGGTLFSLQKLHDKRHISSRDFHELTSAYSFLRHLEHRLQLRQGLQVHHLPRSDNEMQVLRRSMESLATGDYHLTDLAAAVRLRMSVVGEIYQRVIYQEEAQRPPEPETAEFQLRSLPEASVADRSHRQLVLLLAEKAPELSQILKTGPPESAENRNLLRFLSSAFSSSERYAAVLRHQTAIARSLSLFELSEYLTETLVRYPEEVSSLEEAQSGATRFISGNLFNLSPNDQPGDRDPVFAYIAGSTAEPREKVSLLRRHFRHRMFSSGARDIAELRPIYASFAETTAAAEEAIAAAFGIVGAPEGLAVLALGRVGSREFDLLSDADLLFVCDEQQDRGILSGSAERMMQTLSAYTQEGMVFPVDTRLRPRGGEGELLVTPSHLEEYFGSEAQPWEALMYTKLRFICGDAGLGRRATAAAENLFRRFAGDASFPGAVRQMRQRLEDASAPDKSIRTSPGAIYDADFLSGFLLVKHGICPKLGTLRDRLWRCAAAGVLEKKDAASLDHAAELCRTVEHVLRLVVGRKTRWLTSGEHARHSTEKLSAQILRRDPVDGWEQDLLRSFEEVRAIYDRVVC